MKFNRIENTSDNRAYMLQAIALGLRHIRHSPNVIYARNVMCKAVRSII